MAVGKELLRYPHDAEQHMVRESLWYALGLVLESRHLGKPHARMERAEKIVSSVLANQFNAPGRIWHVTFKRAPEEVDPPEKPFRIRSQLVHPYLPTKISLTAICTRS